MEPSLPGGNLARLTGLLNVGGKSRFPVCGWVASSEIGFQLSQSRGCMRTGGCAPTVKPWRFARRFHPQSPTLNFSTRRGPPRKKAGLQAASIINIMTLLLATPHGGRTCFGFLD